MLPVAGVTVSQSALSATVYVVEVPLVRDTVVLAVPPSVALRAALAEPNASSGAGGLSRVTSIRSQVAGNSAPGPLEVEMRPTARALVPSSQAAGIGSGAPMRTRSPPSTE